MKSLVKVLSLLAIFTLTLACGGGGIPLAAPVNSLTIMADNQVKGAFEDTGIISYCEKQTGVNLEIVYKVSTSLRVENLHNSGAYDGFWATSNIFLPNTPTTPVFTAKTYIVAATYDDVAAEMGLSGNTMLLKQMLDGIDSGTMKPLMAQLGQTDPSASFWIAVLSQLAGENMLTQEGLKRVPVDTLRRNFGGLLHSPDSADALMAEIVSDRVSGANRYNTYVLTEAMAYKVNTILVSKGLEPFRVYYIPDATYAEKFPVVFTGDNVKRPGSKDAFGKIADCLSRDQWAVDTLEQNGYRTHFIGMSQPNADKTVFRPEWGLDASMADLPLKDYPRPEVILDAFDLFQSQLKPAERKVFCADFSGSMNDNGGYSQLVKGSNMIFDQTQARENSISIGPDDAYTVFVFAYGVTYLGTAYGSDKPAVTALAGAIESNPVDGGTAMFDCVREAILFLTRDPRAQFQDPDYPSYDPVNYVYGIYVLTDGDTNQGWEWPDFKSFYDSLPPEMKIRIYGVGFGGVRDGLNDPLPSMVTLSGGLYRDGRVDLADVLKILFTNY